MKNINPAASHWQFDDILVKRFHYDKFALRASCYITTVFMAFKFVYNSEVTVSFIPLIRPPASSYAL